MFGNFSSNQPATSTPLFGGANTTSSPFGSTPSTTTTNNPMFGASASTTTPASNSLFGNTPATTTTTTPLFGNASTGATSAPAFGSSLTAPTASNSPFGSTASSLNTNTTASPFGTASKPTTSAPLFGTANTIAPATSGFTFGGAATSTATSTPSLSSFSAAPAVEAKPALSDGTVPHYTIGPHSIMRQTAPPPSSSAGFMPNSQKEAETKLSASDVTTKPQAPAFQEKRTVLPGFLTSVGSSPKSEIASNVNGNGTVKSAGSTSSSISSGLFGTTGQDYGYGSRKQAFDASDDNEAPPMLSMWEIGVHQPAPNAFPSRPLGMGYSWNSLASNKVGTSANVSTTGSAHENMQTPIPSTMATFGQSSFASSNNEYPSTSYSESDQATINVCGFPPSMTSYILDHFRQYGEILDYRNSGSNWMTITYSTRLSAQKALSRNGKIIGGNCMIGVSPANQQNVFGAVTSPELSKDDKGSSKPLVGRPIQVDRTGQVWRSTGLGSGRAGPSATMANGQNHQASNVVGGVLAHAKDALFAW